MIYYDRKGKKGRGKDGEDGEDGEDREDRGEQGGGSSAICSCLMKSFTYIQKHGMHAVNS